MANCSARFMDNNMALPETARITYSSSKAGFPGTNAYDQRRSRLWIPGGNFTLTETNNRVRFGDEGGVKTGTVTAGNYTYSTLATAISTAMNLTSSNWSCSYSTATRKFTILRSSGVNFLRTDVSTNAIWSTIGFYATTSSQYASSYPSDIGVNHTDEWYKADFVQPVSIDAFMACWGIDQPSPFSGVANVRIQMNNIDQWDAPPVDVALTPFDRGIFQFFEDTDTVYRYARFWFQDKQASDGPEGFYFGNIYMGSYRTVTISNVAPGISKKLEDGSETQATVNGGEFSRKKPKARAYGGMEMQLLDADERRALEQTIANLGNTERFYFCLDPLSEVTADLDEATWYAKFTSEPDLKHIIRDRYTLSFDLKETI